VRKSDILLFLLAISMCLALPFEGTPRARLPFASLYSTPTGPIPSTLFGMHIILGNFPTANFATLRTSGASWRHLEPQRGVFNWTVLDNQINMAQAHNLKVYYATDYVPQWAAKDLKTCSQSGCTSGVANLADWENFVTAMVRRYKGKIEVYELWNEPDQDFSGPMSDFLPLAQHFRDIVRSNDPRALITTPAVATVKWMDAFWAAGGVKDIDAAAFHGYLSGSPPAPEELAERKVDPLKAIMAKHGLSDKPIWDSEGSWGDPNVLKEVEAQAAFVARYYLLHWSNGVGRFYWYSWDDSGDGPGGVGWGSLFNPATHTPLPAATAYKQVYNWMVGATMTTPCTASSSTWTCGLVRQGGFQALAIWDTSGAKTYTPPDQYTSYQNLAGNIFPIVGPLTIGSEPLLLMNTRLPGSPTNESKSRKGWASEPRSRQ
jgi:hypothetical protein